MKVIKIYFISTIILVMQLIMSISAHADVDESEAAKGYINDLSSQIYKIANDEHTSKMQKKDLFEKIMLENVDMQKMSKFVLGKYWKSLTVQEKKDFSIIYKDFLIYSYLPKFLENSSYSFSILNAIKSENHYIVYAQVTLPNGLIANIKYRVSKNVKFMIEDIMAENISIIATQKADFINILSGGNIESLKEMMQEKIAESRALLETQSTDEVAQ